MIFDIIFKVLLYHFGFYIGRMKSRVHSTNFYLTTESSLYTHFIIQECPKNPSLLASENGNNEIVGSVSISATTNGVYPSTLIENPRTDQETLTTNSSFGPEMVPQHQSFHHQDDYSRSFNAVENFPGMVGRYLSMH